MDGLGELVNGVLAQEEKESNRRGKERREGSYGSGLR